MPLHSIELELETKWLAMLNVEHFPLLAPLVRRAPLVFKEFLLSKTAAAFDLWFYTGKLAQRFVRLLSRLRKGLG